MKKNVLFFKGEFDGIYELGVGWMPGAYDKWRDFWGAEFRKIGPVYWEHFARERSYDDSEYLVSIDGSACLHPLKFAGTLTGSERCGERFTAELEELKNLCGLCAEFCGATFKLEQSGEVTAEFDGMEAV